MAEALGYGAGGGRRVKPLVSVQTTGKDYQTNACDTGTTKINVTTCTPIKGKQPGINQ